MKYQFLQLQEGEAEVEEAVHYQEEVEVLGPLVKEVTLFHLCRVMEAGFPMQKEMFEPRIHKERNVNTFFLIFTFYLSRILTHFLQIISDYCIAYFCFFKAK